MTRTTTLMLCLLANCMAFSQFNYNFNDISDLAATEWLGDTDHFVITEAGELRLQAPEAGTSRIYHRTNLPDSLEIRLTFRLDFSPSVNNRLRIFLQLDTFKLDQASGYLLEIGENGSEDRIRFIRMIHGEELVIAEGTPGLFGSDPAGASFRINRSGNGLWQLFIKKNHAALYETELELFDSTLKNHFDQYFGLECNYTVTRKDRFYFDDIFFGEAVKDTLPPDLISAEIIYPKTISLVFDEILDNQEVIRSENYRLIPGNYSPDSISFNEFEPNLVKLHFALEFESNLDYHLVINGLADLNGNFMSNYISAAFYLKERPVPGDLVINEILFDPVSDGYDFVELYNRSGKILILDGLRLDNLQKVGETVILEGVPLLFPGKYLALTPDRLSLQAIYPIPDSAQIFVSEIPSFNNDKGNVSIWSDYGIKQVIDSFDYHDDYHFELLIDTEGISLERILAEGLTNDPDNWQSAGTLYGGATPGFRNSQAPGPVDTIPAYFSVRQDVFSPNNDGYLDQLIIDYALPGDGFVGNVWIFDASGKFTYQLVNNELMGNSGSVIWDGLGPSGQYCDTGPYVILCTVFHPRGNRHRQKLVAYLAEAR